MIDWHCIQSETPTGDREELLVFPHNGKPAIASYKDGDFIINTSGYNSIYKKEHNYKYMNMPEVRITHWASINYPQERK